MGGTTTTLNWTAQIIVCLQISILGPWRFRPFVAKAKISVTDIKEKDGNIRFSNCSFLCPWWCPLTVSCPWHLWSRLPLRVLPKSMQWSPISSMFPSSLLSWPLAPSPWHQTLSVYPCFRSLLHVHLQITISPCRFAFPGPSKSPHVSGWLAAWFLIPPTQMWLECAHKGDGSHFTHQDFEGSLENSGKCVQLADG